MFCSTAREKAWKVEMAGTGLNLPNWLTDHNLGVVFTLQHVLHDYASAIERISIEIQRLSAVVIRNALSLLEHDEV